MSLSNKLDKLFEAKLNFEEEIDEANVTGAGEVFNTPNAFSKDGEEDENNNAELLGYTKVKNESAFKAFSKQMFLGEAKYKEYKDDEI